MEKRKLGRTDIDVSPICLGTMTYGEQNTAKEGFAQMDRAFEAGINFLDMAELYAIPPKAETAGRTEEIVGDWMQARGNRDQIVVATKVVGSSDGMDWFRNDGSLPRLDRANILEAVDKSLERLKTDYIDLYQVHWPDRPVSGFGNNPSQYTVPASAEGSVPIEETLAAMDEIVKAGKVRAVGISNESAWGTMRYLEAHRSQGYPRVQSIQNAYNFMNRTFETALAEIAIREQVGLLAYSVLAQGYLTGKYRNGATPERARRTLFGRMGRYEGVGAAPAIEAYLQLADDLGVDPSMLAIAHCTSRPFTTATIIGATTMAQLDVAIASMDLTITDEIEMRINDLHKIHGNTCP